MWEIFYGLIVNEFILDSYNPPIIHLPKEKYKFKVSL